MTQSNLVDFNKTRALNNLEDNASMYALQAQAALLMLTANDKFHELSRETIGLILWAVTDRLEDLENLFSNWCCSEISDLSEEASKFAGQAKQIIIAYQDGGLNDLISPDIFSNALWFVSDRIRDVIKLIEQINIAEAT